MPDELELKIRKLLKENADNPDINELVDQWFAIHAKRQAAHNWLVRFAGVHQSDDFEEWLCK